MIILGIETSSDVCSVGLTSGENVIAERSVADSHIHSEKLQTLTLEVLEKGKVKLRDLSAIAVSAGPGSFTGLRIGMSSAKGFCAAVGIPLILVPTFDGVAAAVAARNAGSIIGVAVDARQGDWYTAVYEFDGTRVAPMEPVRMTDVEGLKRSLTRANVVAADNGQVVAPLLLPGALVVPFREQCRGGMIAREGLRKLRQHEVADLESAVPMYLKDFVVRAASA